MSTGGNNTTNFNITKTELVVTSKTGDNNKLNKLLQTGFERSVF